MTDIREIEYNSDEYKTLLQLRYEMLRKPRGIELSDNDTAGDDRKFHLAAFENGKPVGCVLLRPVDTRTLWLHQMAVSSECQGQGIGAALVRHAERLATARGFKTMEMHANKMAQGFYERLGYQTAGEEFVENNVPAIKMHKALRAISMRPPAGSGWGK